MAQTSARARRPDTRSVRLILAGLTCLTSAACETGTGPVERRPELAINTMAIQVAGSTMSFSSTVTALGGVQHVTQNLQVTAAREGMYIYADPQGLPFAISVPGLPNVGESAVGRWDPRAMYLREEGELSADPRAFERNRPIINVARTPSIAFGEHRAAVLGEYASIPGGVLSIDEISIPDRRVLLGNAGVAAGRVRGHISFRAARDSLLTDPDTPFSPDTIDVDVDFHVELENWPDGRAAVRFTDGALSGLPPLAVVGSATDWIWDTDPARQIVIGLGGVPYDNGDVLTLWFGTRLTGRGSANIEAMDPALTIGPDAWPDHFVAGIFTTRAGDEYAFRSVRGTIELHEYQPSTHIVWGEVHGTLNVELAMQTGSAHEPVTVDISFQLPLGYIINYCVQTCTGGARMHGGTDADLRLWQPRVHSRRDHLDD